MRGRARDDRLTGVIVVSVQPSGSSPRPDEVEFVPWRRYGHDRVYVHVSGTGVGYLDRVTGQVHVDGASKDWIVDALRRRGYSVGTPAASSIANSPTFAPYREAMTQKQEARRAARREGRLRSFAERSWREPTLSEKALADALTSASPFVWHREYRVDPYRLDFFCASARLAVEVDGSSHRRRREDDAARDAALAQLGIVTMRIDARDVEKDCGAVVARINRRCIERTGQVPQTDVPGQGW